MYRSSLIALGVFVLGAGSTALVAGCAERAPAASDPPAPAVHAIDIAVETLAPTSAATAEILANRQANIRAETAGRVTDVLVEVGQRVQLGEVLIRLDVGRTTSVVQAAQAGLAEARARLAQAQREQARVARLVKAGGLPSQQLDDAQDAVRVATAARDAALAETRLQRRGLSEARVRAPFAGTIVERVIEVGEYVSPGTPLVTMADTSKLKARVLLDPREALDVQVGAPVVVSAHARPGETFKAEVVRVGEVIDPRTRRLPIEVELSDTAGRLRPGLAARFEVETGAPRPTIRLPMRATFERFGSQHVYVVADGVAKRRSVELGVIRDARAEITKGLTPGEQVVVEGVSRVVDGSPVRVVPSDAQPKATQQVTPQKDEP